MLRIRLRRVGKKGKPSYRIVVAEASAPRDGAYVEWIGNYDPMIDPPAFTIKMDRAQEWLGKGAQPSDAVQRILDWHAAAESAVAANGDEPKAEPVVEEMDAVAVSAEPAAENVASEAAEA